MGKSGNIALGRNPSPVGFRSPPGRWPLFFRGHEADNPLHARAGRKPLTRPATVPEPSPDDDRTMSRRRKPTAPTPPPDETREAVPDTSLPAAEGRALVLVDTDGESISLPECLPLLPLRSDVVFPQTVVPLVVNRTAGMRLIDEVLLGDKTIGLVTQRNPDEDEPTREDLYPTLSVGTILKMLKFPDGSTRVVVQGIVRARLLEIVQEEPYLIGRVEPLEEVVRRGVELDALVHHIRGLFDRLVEQSQQVPEELQVATLNTHEPGRLADLLGSSLPFPVDEKQDLLGELDVRVRLEKLASYLTRQLAVMELAGKIQAQVGSEITRAQREHFLRQQIKAIQEELGESESENPELEALWQRLEDAKPPGGVLAEAERELERLAAMHPSSAEYSIVRTYLDWIAALPWAKSSRDRLDLKRARKILDEDHYDLDKIKERILEYLAVRKLKKDMKGPILCLVGPPGTGKTSLGRSIARALGREFVRVSLGGVHDEAEIRGHRRTYVGALPGNIIQGIRRAGARNAVMMLDEIDKLGRGIQGDPSAAMLEVLDPEQNSTFRDNYLAVPFDLSRVVFITTANVLDTIPGPLRDRMEIIQLSGYTDGEKLEIAKRYLIRRQLEANGLKAEQAEITDAALREIIDHYTREAGVRNLEREIGRALRYAAVEIAEGRSEVVTLDVADLQKVLGPPRFENEVAMRTSLPGVATGLAWTPVGGDILFIEATRTPGSGRLILTGQLGDVMKESAQAALSLVKSRLGSLGIDEGLLEKSDIHIHVPAGAIPKDGPSAGVAMTMALVSLLTSRTIRSDTAMTGEISLRGLVLPIGGVKEKSAAAARAGLTRVMLPARNMKDLEEVSEDARRQLEFIPLETIDQAIEAALEPPREKAAA